MAKTALMALMARTGSMGNLRHHGPGQIVKAGRILVVILMAILSTHVRERHQPIHPAKESCNDE